MYNEHVPLIAQQAKSIEGFLAVCRFTMHSIRRPFNRIDVDNKITSTTEEGWSHLVDNVDKYFEAATSEEFCLTDRFYHLLDIKGLNLPKVGFALQMCGHPIGCIDTHHIQDFNKKHKFELPSSRPYKSIRWETISKLSDRVLKANKRPNYNYSPYSDYEYNVWRNRDLVTRYVGLCYHEPMKNPEHMWNSWCDKIAIKYNKDYKDGYQVSAHHLSHIIGFRKEIENGKFGTSLLWSNKSNDQDKFEAALCAV